MITKTLAECDMALLSRVVPQSTCGWSIICCSVKGAMHAHNGKPNQDAVLADPVLPTTQKGVVAVADGDGSDLHFRSQMGAQLAVNIATRLARTMLTRRRSRPAHWEKLPGRIHREWRRAVRRHQASHAFTQEELSTLSAAQLRGLLLNDCMAYGTTLLLAIVSGRRLTVLQLGDGDILLVDDAGAVTPVNQSEEPRRGEGTESLCLTDAAVRFRCFSQEFQSAPRPACVILATDGYKKSFPTDEGFFKVGEHLLSALRRSGEQSVRRALPGWLESTSSDGSGDDITVGILYRYDPVSGEPWRE
jgi:serine/threonine protein phosphatase PrpC